jgi:hypothetical protein
VIKVKNESQTKKKADLIKLKREKKKKGAPPLRVLRI